MRILIATWHRQVVGGAETYIRALLPQLLSRGHELGFVHGYTSDPRERVDAQAPGIPRWCLEDLGIDQLLEKIAAWRPDVVYTHGLESLELETKLAGAYSSVLFSHGYYGTCATGAKCHSRPRHSVCTRKLGPMCLVLHYPRGCGGLHPLTTWNNYRDQVERNALIRRLPGVIVASLHMERELLNNGVAPDRVHIAPLPPTDVQGLTEPPVRRAPAGTILLSCRLTKVKGGEYLLKALPQASEKLGRKLHLVVAGSGAEEHRLRELAARLEISAEFLGWVDASRRCELIRQCDLIAFPSIWPEPFGLSGIEAGSMGVPAVGYAVGSVPEWLVPGVSGELAPGNPPAAAGLAEAIVRALRDPKHYYDLCVGAWEVSQRFTWANHLDKLENVLQSVVSDARNSTAIRRKEKIVVA